MHVCIIYVFKARMKNTQINEFSYLMIIIIIIIVIEAENDK